MGKRQNFVKLHHNIQYSYSRKYIPKKHNLGREVFKQINKHIANQVADGMLESKEGVFLEGIGYFYVFLSPVKRNSYIRKINRVYILNREAYPMFTATGRGNLLTSYQLSYEGDLKLEVKRRIKRRQYYKFRLSLLLHPRQYERIVEYTTKKTAQVKAIKFTQEQRKRWRILKYKIKDEFRRNISRSKKHV